MPQHLQTAGGGLHLDVSMKILEDQPVRVALTGLDPKVSVLIPVYNGGANLAECLDSILVQDFADLEILVADDSSTDDSLSIIAKYSARDSRIRHWKNPRRLGLTANSNACLRQARGEYIKFVHQDDRLLCRSAIRKMVAALDHHPSAVLVGCRQHLTGSKSWPLIFSDRSGLYDGRQMILSSLESNTNLIGQPTLNLFRKSHAQRGFDERFTGHMDFEMWCHLLEQGDFVYLAEPLATWRVHEHHQTARMKTSNIPDREHLLLMDIYYARPWLRQTASARLLFSQIYHLRKKYGTSAGFLTRQMMADLSPCRYAWLWLKHKVTRPFLKLFRKLNRLKYRSNS
jgi:glycosyltransferase involved in cell wall biosynthesis